MHMYIHVCIIYTLYICVYISFFLVSLNIVWCFLTYFCSWTLTLLTCYSHDAWNCREAKITQILVNGGLSGWRKASAPLPLQASSAGSSGSLSRCLEPSPFPRLHKGSNAHFIWAFCLLSWKGNFLEGSRIEPRALICWLSQRKVEDDNRNSREVILSWFHSVLRDEVPKVRSS